MNEQEFQTPTFNHLADRPRFAGDPVKFLQIFLVMSQAPSRREIGFDHADLQYCADVWEQAAIVTFGDAAFTHEQRRYQKLCDDLKAGMMERKTRDGVPVGIVVLDSPSDWPDMRTILRALKCLEHAEVRGIH